MQSVLGKILKFSNRYMEVNSLFVSIFIESFSYKSRMLDVKKKK